jgi:hypothetical protein
MVAEQWISRRRYDRREPRKKLERRHHAVLGAPVAQLLDAIGDAATR